MHQYKCSLPLYKSLRSSYSFQINTLSIFLASHQIFRNSQPGLPAPATLNASSTQKLQVRAIASARLRLCVHKVPGLTIPTFTIPCDPNCALRLAAAARFQRVTQGKRSAIDRSAEPSTYQRTRWVQFLTLHDALEAGASSRDLAFGFVFRGHRPLTGAIWKGSGERRHVLRLIADARRIVSVGYRKLLLHR